MCLITRGLLTSGSLLLTLRMQTVVCCTKFSSHLKWKKATVHTKELHCSTMHSTVEYTV